MHGWGHMDRSWLDRLGIELPIVQAPMAGVQDSALAIAVAQAGGLGSLPCALWTPEAARRQVQAVRAAGVQAVNMNFFCHELPATEPRREQAWQQLLQPYYEEMGLSVDEPRTTTLRQPFNAEMAALVVELRPTVLSFHFGLPRPALLAMVRRSGAQIWASATTVPEALWLAERGVDAVIAQGLEAGGHRGMFLNMDINTQLGTFALLPQVVRAVRLPVIAAGGIADSSGVRAAMNLGATAVQIGSSYLLCPEANTSAVHRAALASPAAYETVLTRLFSGRPARSIVNRLIRELGPMHEQAPAFPYASIALAPLRAQAEALGRHDFSPLWAGQNVSGCQAIPAASLTRSLMQGF